MTLHAEEASQAWSCGNMDWSMGMVKALYWVGRLRIKMRPPRFFRWSRERSEVGVEGLDGVLYDRVAGRCKMSGGRAVGGR